jgi:signal transduction histidine kinase
MDLSQPSSLRIDSTLRDLNLCSYEADIADSVFIALDLFNRNFNAPAVILKEGGRYKGMISRFRLFENMSKPFSRELFLKRSMGELCDLLEYENNIILNESVSILDAAKIVLDRPIESFLDPIVVKGESEQYYSLDVHQLMRAQTTIHDLTLNSLEEANTLKSQLLSVVSHNLKNPLNLVMGYAKLIEEESNGNDMIEEPSRIIYQSSQRMLDIISQFMNLAEYEDGIQTAQKEKIVLKELALCVLKENSGKAESKKQTLLFSGDSEDLILHSDNLKLRSVLDNLISNAIKYAPIGGKIYLKMKSNNGHAVISVSDNGPGIKDEDKERLFKRFQRLSAKPTGGEVSTGLGLYITKHYVESLGGSIDVSKSMRLAGAKFTVSIPIEPNLN